jgi:transcriptional regulator
VKEAAVIAGRLGSDDPTIGLQAVAALRRLLDRVERLQVDAAREQGLLWQEIARELGVTKQAVHAKHAARRRAEQKEA